MKLLSAVGMVVVMGAGCASAQMMVHGITGTVKSVSPSQLLVVADKSVAPSPFVVMNTEGIAMNFGQDVRDGSVDARKFDKVGDYAVVYYYGYGNDQTAVAVKDLGAGPFLKVKGTVEAYDKHSHTLHVKDDAGKDLTLTLPAEVVVDTDSGVDVAKKLSLHKGDRVRVTYAASEPATVAFLGEML